MRLIGVSTTFLLSAFKTGSGSEIARHVIEQSLEKSSSETGSAFLSLKPSRVCHAFLTILAKEY